MTHLDPTEALRQLQIQRDKTTSRYDRKQALERIAHCPSMADTPWYRGERPDDALIPAAPTPPPAPSDQLTIAPGSNLYVVKVDGTQRLSLREAQAWWVHGDNVVAGVHHIQGHPELHVTDDPQGVVVQKTMALESRVRLHLHPGLLGTLAMDPGDQVLVIAEAPGTSPRRIRLRHLRTLFTSKEQS